MSKSKIIYVPQGCYAEITRSTPEEVKGLMTSGISTCCHVVVTNPKTGYMALCHADASTDLTHNETGVPAWVRKACAPDGKLEDVTVFVGETRDHPRPGGDLEAKYLKQVQT
ncbi:MAG: hypothetical protein AABY27_06775 [Pseudomonadota bacterium]